MPAAPRRDTLADGNDRLDMSTTTTTRGGNTPASLAMDQDPARRRLGDALLALEAAGVPFAARAINDEAVRQQYRRSIQDAVQEIIAEVDSGQVSAEIAAARAVDMRNTLMDLARQRSSDLGRAIAEQLKPSGKTLEELIAYRARQLFNKAPEALTGEQRTAVMREIIAGAARDRPAVTGALRFLGPASRGLVALSIGLAIYDIYEAPDHLKEAGHQGVVAGAGLGGSLVVGALGTSLVCGPGAPVCAGIFVLVGGVAFSVGADFWWRRLTQ
jgi:hypothetical protein